MNNVKINCIAVLLAGLFYAAVSNAAKPPEKIDVRAKNETTTSQMKQMLQNCQSVYTNELETMNLNIDMKVLDAQRASQYANLSLERLVAQDAVMKEKSKNGFEYKKCVDAAKTDIDTLMKPYISSFKNDPIKSIAKQIISQWMVTIDAVGQKHFPQEVSKFDRLVNDMKVELAIN